MPGAAGRAAVQLTCPCTGRGERGGGRHPERSALAGRPTALRLLPCTAWVLPQEKLEAFIDNVAVPPALIHGIVQASEGGSRAEVCVLAPRSTGHPGASRCTNCCPAAAGRDRRRFCGAPQSAECQARVGGQRRERHEPRKGDCPTNGEVPVVPPPERVGASLVNSLPNIDKVCHFAAFSQLQAWHI